MACVTQLISNIDVKGSIDVLRPSNSLLSVILIVFAYIFVSSIFGASFLTGFAFRMDPVLYTRCCC